MDHDVQYIPVKIQFVTKLEITHPIPLIMLRKYY